MAAGPGERNPVSFLYEYSSKNKYPSPVFIDNHSETGGYREFMCTVKLEIPDLILITASGKTKVLAKREACRKAVAQLFPSLGFTKCGNLIIPDPASAESALPQSPTESTADRRENDGVEIKSDCTFAQRSRHIAETYRSSGGFLKRKLSDASDTSDTPTAGTQAQVKTRTEDGFPEMDESHPQQALVAAVRDVQWPERTFGVPRTVKGDEIEIEVRVGPRQNTSLYNAAGISETLLGAKNEACKKLFKILYDDPSFNRIWDQRMCTVRPVLKKLKTTNGHPAIPPQMDIVEPQPRNALENLKASILSIIADWKAHRTNELVCLENGEIKVMAPAAVLREVCSGLPALKMAASFTAEEEAPIKSKEQSFVSLDVRWADPGTNHGYPRLLHFDASDATHEKAADKCTEEFFMFLDLDRMDYRLPVSK